MGVFNPQQVLISPVTNYYQGKAIRQQQAAAEQDMEFRGLQMEQIKQEMDAAPGQKLQADELYRQKYKAAELSIEQAELELGRGTMEYMASTLAPLTAKATDFTLQGGDPNEAAAMFTQDVASVLPNLPPAVAKRVAEAMGEDKQFSVEEISNLKVGLSAWLKKEGGDRTSSSFVGPDGKTHKGSFDKAGNYYYSDGKPVLGRIRPIEGKSTSVTVNNTMGDPSLTPAVETSLQKTLLDSDRQLDGLNSIAEAFDEDFLNLKGDVLGAVLSAGNYMGIPLDANKKKFLEDRVTFLAEAAESFNVYINTLSGAAVSPDEAVRLMAGFPNIEDNPIEYAAKLKAKIKQVNIARARAALALELGVTGIGHIANLSALNGESFTKALNRAGDQWLAQGMTPEQIIEKSARIQTISDGVSAL